MGIFREDIEEDVIEESGGVKEAIKDRSGVGNRSRDGEKVGDYKVVLFKTFVDYVGVELLKVRDCFAGFNEK